MFERFIARHAIQKDNLTLLGHELRFRANDCRAGASNGFSAAYLIDASTMVFHWESLTANALASLGELELLSGVAVDKEAREHSLPALPAFERSTCAFYPAFSPSIAAM